ncbi:MFS transporter [Amycolatopsis thermophila]|uniref:MFS transporter n=1 Tax=Amycolatopsis thermophila TaxID=206084 RepID=A0ABU0ELG8_9PSEU|nr:MFS transporter [Amycolatopsis thermophila]MDQ0376029.1 putative MFS transporter [Amycolatopsis thermophila]
MSIDATPATTQGDIAARLERLPMSRWQITVRLLIGVVTFFEAFDQLLIAYTLPVLSREWNLSAATSTAALTIGSVGMLLGALVSGWAADRVGRVRVIALCVGISALCSVGMAAFDSLTPFLVLRFVQGLAIGGEVPTAAAYISEITRAHKRGRFVLLYEVVFPAGLAVSALVAAWLIPLWGWRSLYLLAAVPGLMAFVIVRAVPESPRWLASRGKFGKAAAAMAVMEMRIQRSTGEPLPAPAPAAPVTPPEKGNALRDLFAGRYRRRTLTVWTIWFVGYLANYGITSWLPTIYRGVFHLPLGQALWYSTATSGAGLVGCVLAALVIDRVGRRVVLAAGLGATTAMLVALGALGAGSPVQMLVWSSLAAVFNFAVNISLYLYTPELYPTRSRALGCSLGGVMNRLGLILGPILVGAVYAGGTALGSVFLLISGITLVGTIVAAVFAEETRGRTLEEIAP